MKKVIIYASYHHKNTKNIVDEISRKEDYEVIDLLKEKDIDLSCYDIIGFASGIYFGKMHKRIIGFIEKAEFKNNQRVFLMYTCGFRFYNYVKGLKKTLREKGIKDIPVFYSRGYDSYAIWGKLGGIAKNHPNEEDIKRALKFVKEIK
ncbi:flavodoxin domain-containing protein [Anaerofustis butyriciformans]|uniref:flavodoxin domain-containing protein n=1 Tax=Anaerofustis butyriciformans TaxID=3108533 RepID=UPI003F8B8A77